MSAPSLVMIPCPDGCGNEMPAARLEIDGTNGICGECNTAHILERRARIKAMEDAPCAANGYGKHSW